MSEEYLDTGRLLARVPYSKREVDRLVAEGHWLDGVHFRRPKGPGTQRIYFWSAIEAWLKGTDWELRRERLERREERERTRA